MDIWQIISIILLVLSMFAGWRFHKAKTLLHEIAEALTVTSKALDDNKISDEERKTLLKEWYDVIMAARDISGK